MPALISIVIEVGTIPKIMAVFVIYPNILTIMKSAVLICINMKTKCSINLNHVNFFTHAH